jgi:hypothetical protein
MYTSNITNLTTEVFKDPKANRRGVKAVWSDTSITHYKTESLPREYHFAVEKKWYFV